MTNVHRRVSELAGRNRVMQMPGAELVESGAGRAGAV